MQEEQQGGGGQRYITMGSVISLSHLEDNDSFIFIDGHIKQKVMVRNFGFLSGKLNDENFGQAGFNVKEDYLAKNLKFSSCLFQILPKLSDKQKDEILSKTKPPEDETSHSDDEGKASNQIKANSRAQGSNTGSNQFDTVKEVNINDNDDYESSYKKPAKKTSLDKDKVIQLQGKLMNEFKANYEAFEKYKHNRITYNQTIQLMHVNSSKFLACYPIEANIEKGNYRVTLDDYTSENTLFRIVPAFKYQKDGDLTIYANEIIVIERVNSFHNKKSILHCSEEINQIKQISFLETKSQFKQIEANFKKADTVQVKLPLRVEQHQHTKKVLKREVNISIENETDPTKWKVNLFSYLMESQQKFLKCGDVIWLHHSEANACLGATRKRELKDMNQNEWHYMDSKENLQVSIVPSDISTNLEEYSGNTYGMWIIEKKNFKVGGYVQFDNFYRLRHLSSGLYLSVESPHSDNSQGIRKPEEVLQMKLVYIPSESSLFQFVSLETNQLSQQQKIIRSDSFVQLRHVLTQTWIDISQNQEIKQKLKKHKTGTNLASVQDLNQPPQVQDLNLIKQEPQTTSIRPFLSQTRSENQVFKLFTANESDVWEINYINSSSKELTKLLKNIQKCQVQNLQINQENPVQNLNITQADYQKIKFMKKKLNKLIVQIKHLNEFCNNRMHNSSFDQKYGSINHYRQKLLREQYYIDILTQLLNIIFEQHEIEYLNNLDDTFAEMNERKQQLKYKQNRNSRKSFALSYTVLKPQDENKFKFNSIDYIKFIKQKRYLCIQIYKLLTSICKQNQDNEQYIYDLFPLFLYHCKYVPQAIDCLISIIGSNEALLLKITDNLVLKRKEGSRNVLNFDRPEFNEIDQKQKQRIVQKRKTSQLLTIMPNAPEQSAQTNSENIMNFFMDLVYDPKAPLKADYYRFLSSVCRFKNDGISLNQESIYKLYKSIQNQNLYASNFVEKFKNGITFPEDPKDLKQLYHQLTFLSDLSFGRNFQWLRELVRHFKFDYLLKNIWENIRTHSTISLSSCFSKLAMALYIDHYPLYRIHRPNFCRIFHDTKKEKYVQRFQADQVDLYQGLLNNLIKYLKDISEKVELEFSNHQAVPQKKNDKDKGQLVRLDTEQKETSKAMGVQILNEDLLYQSVNMLNLLIDLDVFNIMSRIQDYENIIQYLLKILIYDRMNIAFSSTAYFNAKGISEQKQDSKKNVLKKLVNIEGLIKLDDLNIFDDDENDENEEEEDENIDEINKASSKIDENQLYHNPLIRSYLKMNSLLESQIQSEEDGTQLEINIKLQICDLFDKLLDMRQDYLIENTIQWFYRNIGGLMNEKEQSKINDIILDGIAKVMPDIPKTGIIEIDKEYNKPKEENSLLKVLSTDKQRLYKFENFSPNQFYDLDTWLSISYLKNDDEFSNPSFSVLPYLMQSFILMHNPQLEKKSLSLLMRLFNQRQELLQNLNKLEVIFDKQKAILYKIMTENIHELTKLIEQTEDWFEDFIKNDQTFDQCEPINKVMGIIKNLKNCFYDDLQLDEVTLKISPNNSKKIIDSNKQKIFNYLKAYQPILDLIKDGMHHFNAIMSDNSQPSKKKQMVYNLFKDTYELLINFCMNNEDNQILLYDSINALLQYLHYDVGQITLLCEIFRDNINLLKDKSNRFIIQSLIDLILDYGRQHRVLDFFIIFQKCQNTYIFDNQLLILNTFLPINDFGEDELKLLYSYPKQTGDRSQIILDFKNEDKDNNEISFIDYFLQKKTAKKDDTFFYHAKLLNMLLQTTYTQVIDDKQTILNSLNTKQNFNISIAKLKQIDSQFLKDWLIENDNFLKEVAEIPEEDENNILSAPNKHENILIFTPNRKMNQGSVISNFSQKFQLSKDAQFSQRGFTHLKPYILDFLKNVYILGESQSVYQGEIQPSYQFLERVINFETSRIRDIKSANETTEQYATYIFDHVIPFMQAYFDKYLSNIVHYSERDRKDLLDMKQFANELKRNISIFDHKVEFDQNQRIIEFLRRVLQDDAIQNDILKNKEAIFNLNDQSDDHQDQIDSNVFKKDMNLTVQKSESKKNEDSNLLERNDSKAAVVKNKSAFSNLTNIATKLKSINILKQFSSKTNQNAEYDSKISDYSLKKKWNCFLKCLNQTDEVENQIKLEKMALTEALLEVKQLIPADVFSQIEPKPDRFGLIKKSILFLQYAVEDSTNKNTIQVLLKVLRIMVEKCSETPEQEEKMQNILDQLGATRMTLYVISENHKNLDSELLSEFIKFLCTLLNGGNKRVQKTIYEFYISHQKSEMIFKRFDNIIRKQISSIELQAKNQKSKKIISGGTFKQMSQSEGTVDEQEFSFDNDIEVKLLDDVLTFLQLSCEGHYLDLQNYLRQQSNSRNNFDMINAVVDLLKTYYYEARTQKMYDNMCQCLDTINEIVQGPCPENQIAVSEGKFLEIANDLLTSKKQKQEQLLASLSINSKSPRQSVRYNKHNNKMEELENWQVARLQNKCLIVVLSLLEQRPINDSNIIIKKIMRNLSLQQLEYQLVEIYKLYEQLYKDEYPLECLEYLDIDPETVSEKKQLNLECVTQNGFYITYLIQYYMLFDEKQENIFTSLYKQYKAKKLKVNQNALEGLLYGDHLFGQIASFVMSLIKEGVRTANQMKEFALLQLQLKGEEDELRRKQVEEDLHRKKLKKAFLFFCENTAHIDIVRNGEVEVVFFHIMPYMHHLPKEKKTDFHDEVDRQSVKSKVEFLVAKADELIEICKHESRLNVLFSHNKFIAIFANYVNLWKQMTFTMTLILNIFNMISFDATFGDRLNNYLLIDVQNGGRFTQQKTKRIYLILGIIMTVCSVFVVLFFLFKNVPLIIKKTWVVRYGKQKPGIIKQVATFVKLFFKILFQFLQEIEVMYYIAYGVLAVLGTFYHPLFFTFHLTEILIRYPTLKNVIKSVYIPRKSFYLTFILFVIFIYSFTVLAYNFFYTDYQGNCDRMEVCFFLNFDWTFKANGAVGGYLTQKEPGNGKQNQQYTVGRLLFDNLQNYILVVILVEIVAGLIVEAFEDLREKEQEKNRDISDKCFICDNQKTEFNRKQDNNGGFQEHIKLNHHMWNYVNFIAYLRTKDPTDLSGIESYVMSKLEMNDVTWFPINKARELSYNNEDDEEQEQDLIRNMNNSLLSSVENLQELNKLFSKQSKKKQNG
ncbi:MIR domain protein (macronuclear) [Tetrahymena thermophila SB210]|uniref:MIR domain protein n=1 Tax=Tetrahymena thermophila (strain SB210) TaxID=312017 RepID=Q23R11_TETTS|nr:MIR domain protein [Tetrahymena thermophila SB210]EAR98945.2 MIR domain protein [Tetrahymena thermophila SB210]|eukprot:XP_001019190.2 MIR domain protein [Tetrahymena thermophila SB210]